MCLKVDYLNSLLFLSFGNFITLKLYYSDHLFVKTEQHVRTQLVAIRVYVLMVGQDPTAVLISTTVWMLPALMEQLVLMVLAVSTVDALLVRQDFCAISMTLVHRIPAMLMPFVIQVLLMDHLHALVLQATKELIVPKILTNVIKVKYKI